MVREIDATGVIADLTSFESLPEEKSTPPETTPNDTVPFDHMFDESKQTLVDMLGETTVHEMDTLVDPSTLELELAQPKEAKVRFYRALNVSQSPNGGRSLRVCRSAILRCRSRTGPRPSRSHGEKHMWN